MHCIENERELCLDALKRQNLPPVDVFVLSGLANREAHETLYRTFMERAHEVDFFVKVDADMVLSRLSFLQEVSGWMANRPGVDHLEIPVSDLFTDRQIWGLHVYRSHVRWDSVPRGVFLDLNNCIHPGSYAQEKDVLAPAAEHCPDPSPFQCYHYGLHKAVKVIQQDERRVLHVSRMNHWGKIVDIIRHAQRNHDPRLTLALAGAADAFNLSWSTEHLDFNHPEVTKVFRAHDERSLARRASVLKRIIRFTGRRISLRLLTWRDFFPPSRRS